MSERYQIKLSPGVSALIFASLGAASRNYFRVTETRWQIAAFFAAAGAVEIGRKALGFRVSWLRFAFGAGAAASAIVLVKFHLEPQALSEDTARAAHIIRTTAYKTIQ
jgi:hypothetical protein